MKSTKVRTALAMSMLIVLILACGAPGGSSTEAPATDATSAPAPSESIQHQTLPISLPAERSSHAGDYDSSTTAAKKTSAGGDRFTFERFERPFNSTAMDVYFPELDIVDTLVFQDDTWIYGTMTLHGVDANNALSGKYALELDIAQPGNIVDGKGDWLVIASAPASTDWTVNGVQVYEDTNDDVGLELAMLTDKDTSVKSDGFETLVFDQGKGNDPDSAWVRISPNDPNTVEFSVKRSVLGNPEKYLINMWAGHSLIDPALFDLSDHFTHEQAGAADKALEYYYPTKEVAEIDNSCRMAVGFQPKGDEPGLCDSLIPPSSPQACTATTLQIGACILNQPVDYSCQWNKNACKCDCTYIGPK
ncbi:MAG: hypothetical protein K8S20_01315 [Chloroflexi bacterium]|nr:hypothetical protein [Chloroflexota bacterium]